MRFCFLFLALTMIAIGAAHAGALETCREKEKENDAIRSCVRAERVQSINRLRKASEAAQQAVLAKTQESGRRSLLREYRTTQARHVRERSASCRKLANGLEQVACEANMNYAQVEKLARFIE